MYGYPQLTIILNRQLKIKISQRMVYKQMYALKIRSRMTKRMNRPKTHTEYDQRPILIKKLPDQSNILLTDITYILVKNTWVYLASVYNLLTRRVISYKVGSHMTNELATDVINQVAVKSVKPSIIHSDMGSQYTSDLFESTLTRFGIKHSYYRKGQPGDNAKIESFH